MGYYDPNPPPDEPEPAKTAAEAAAIAGAAVGYRGTYRQYAGKIPVRAGSALEAELIAGEKVGYRGKYGDLPIRMARGIEAQKKIDELEKQKKQKEGYVGGVVPTSGEPTPEELAGQSNKIGISTVTVSNEQKTRVYNAQGDLLADFAPSRRPGYYPVESLGDRTTQAGLLSIGMLRRMGFGVPDSYDMAGRILEAQRQAAYKTETLTDDRFFLNEIAKWNRTGIETSSEYHAFGEKLGVPIAANPFENWGDVALAFEKAGNVKDDFARNYAFNPNVRDIIGVLPGGRGLQELGWEMALAVDRKQALPGPVSFAEAIRKVSESRGKMGPYGMLAGGVPDIVDTRDAWNLNEFITSLSPVRVASAHEQAEATVTGEAPQLPTGTKNFDEFYKALVSDYESRIAEYERGGSTDRGMYESLLEQQKYVKTLGVVKTGIEQARYGIELYDAAVEYQREQQAFQTREPVYEFETTQGKFAAAVNVGFFQKIPFSSDINKVGRAFQIESKIGILTKQLDNQIKEYSSTGKITAGEFRGSPEEYKRVAGLENRIATLKTEYDKIASEMTGGFKWETSAKLPVIGISAKNIYDVAHEKSQWYEKNISKPFGEWVISAATETPGGKAFEKITGLENTGPFRPFIPLYSPRVTAEVAAGFVGSPGVAVEFAGMVPLGVETIVRHPGTLPALAAFGIATQVRGVHEGITGPTPFKFVAEQAGVIVALHYAGEGLRAATPIEIGYTEIPTTTKGITTKYYVALAKMPFSKIESGGKSLAGVADMGTSRILLEMPRVSLPKLRGFVGSPDAILAQTGFRTTSPAEFLTPWNRAQHVILDDFLVRNLPRAQANLVKSYPAAIEAAYSRLYVPEQRELFGAVPSKSASTGTIANMARVWEDYGSRMRAGGSRALRAIAGEGARYESLFSSDYDTYVDRSVMPEVYRRTLAEVKQEYPGVEFVTSGGKQKTFLGKEQASITTIPGEEFFHTKPFEVYPYMIERETMKVEAVGGAMIDIVRPQLMLRRKIAAMVSSVEMEPYGTPRLITSRVHDIADAYSLSRAASATMYRGVTVDVANIVTDMKVRRAAALEKFSVAAREYADVLPELQRVEAREYFGEMRVDMLEGVSRSPLPTYDLVTGRGLVAPRYRPVYQAILGSAGAAGAGLIFGVPHLAGIAGVIFPGMKGGEMLKAGEAKLTPAELELYKNQRLFGKIFNFEQALTETPEGATLDWVVGTRWGVSQFSRDFFNKFIKYDVFGRPAYFSERSYYARIKNLVTSHTHPMEAHGYRLFGEAFAEHGLTPSAADIRSSLIINSRQSNIISRAGVTVMELPPEIRAMTHADRLDMARFSINWEEFIAPETRALREVSLWAKFDEMVEGKFPQSFKEKASLGKVARLEYGRVKGIQSMSQFAHFASKMEMKVSFIRDINLETGVGNVRGFSQEALDLAGMYEKALTAKKIYHGAGLETVFGREMFKPGEGLYIPEAEMPDPFAGMKKTGRQKYPTEMARESSTIESLTRQLPYLVTYYPRIYQTKLSDRQQIYPVAIQRGTTLYPKPVRTLLYPRAITIRKYPEPATTAKYPIRQVVTSLYPGIVLDVDYPTEPVSVRYPELFGEAPYPTAIITPEVYPPPKQVTRELYPRQSRNFELYPRVVQLVHVERQTMIAWGGKETRGKRRKRKRGAEEWFIWNPTAGMSTTFGYALNIREVMPTTPELKFKMPKANLKKYMM